MTNHSDKPRFLGRVVSAMSSLLPSPPSDEPPPPDPDGKHGRDQLTAEDRLRINAQRKDGTVDTTDAGRQP